MDLSVFDAWEPIRKSGTHEGLLKWDRLSVMAKSLRNKKASDLSFTTCYPGQEGSKKTLGSLEGNMHFLLGYGNPLFHFAPYHLQVMDPNLSDEEARELFYLQGHPSKVELWERTSLKPKVEGDEAEGQPHPSASVVVDSFKKRKAREEESIVVESGAGKYRAVPSEGLVYGEHNRHVYVWEMIKESFFAAANPELVEAMDKPTDSARKSVSYADPILYHSKLSTDFDPQVYPLVKSLFPKPGSIIPLHTHQDELVYVVVKSNSICVFDAQGCQLPVKIYDRVYNEVDLTKEGNTYPSVIASFAKSVLKIPVHDFAHSNESESEDVLQAFGNPTPGFEDVEEAVLGRLHKSVELIDGTYRLVIS